MVVNVQSNLETYIHCHALKAGISPNDTTAQFGVTRLTIDNLAWHYGWFGSTKIN